MNTYFVLPTLFAIIILCGCKKENRINNTTSGEKLKRISQYRPSLASTLFNDYYYDLQNRVIEIIEYEKTNTGDSIPVDRALFYYIGTDSLPARLHKLTNNIWHDFVYDAQKKLVKDSITKIINPVPITGRATFEYYPNYHLCYHSQPSSGLGSTTKDSLIFLNNNLKYMRTSFDIYNPFPPVEYLEQDYIQYDNKKNPVYSLNIGELYYNYRIVNTGVSAPAEIFYSKNNPISRNSYDSYMNTHFQSGIVTYTYNTNDLPTKKIEVKNNDTLYVTTYMYE